MPTWWSLCKNPYIAGFGEIPTWKVGEDIHELGGWHPWLLGNRGSCAQSPCRPDPVHLFIWPFICTLHNTLCNQLAIARKLVSLVVWATVANCGTWEGGGGNLPFVSKSDGSFGWPWDQLFEIGIWSGGSLVGLRSALILVISVRNELNCRTPSWSQRFVCWGTDPTHLVSEELWVWE